MLLIERRAILKILITSKGKTKDTMIDTRFGRANFFALYTTDQTQFEFKENEAKNSLSGAGVKAGQIAIDEDVDVVITGHLGPKAFKVLETGGIKKLKVNEKSLQATIEAFKRNELVEIIQPSESRKRK